VERVNPAPPILETRRLSVRLAATLALDGVDLTLRRGEVRALVGRNGAGKTTLLRACAGLVAPVSGEARLDGASLASLAPRARAARVAFVAQRPSVAAGFLVEEVVAIGRYALPADPGRIAAAIDRLGLEPLRARRFPTLSVGEQHRVAFARALAQVPADGLLVVDEPFAALDLGEAERIRRLLRAHAEGGGAVLVSIHEPGRLEGLADRVTLLAAGRVALEAPLAELGPGELERLGAELGAPIRALERDGRRYLVPDRP